MHRADCFPLTFAGRQELFGKARLFEVLCRVL